MLCILLCSARNTDIPFQTGLPLYVYRLASLSPVQKELDAIPAEHRYQSMYCSTFMSSNLFRTSLIEIIRVALYEVMTQFVMPLCTYLPHPTLTPISSVTTIIDLKDVSLGSMWTLRNHLQEASRLATANYPETLNNIAVVNSPSFFPTIWGWIKVSCLIRTVLLIYTLEHQGLV
jgi:hypothetical protein